MRKEMQTLLSDIELDIQELKFLMEAIAANANPKLRVLARRNIQQMRARLDEMQQLLEDASVVETVAPVPPVAVHAEPISVPVVDEAVIEEPMIILPEPAEVNHNPVEVNQEPVASSSSASPILAERIKPATDLRHAISLNDSFRFAREIFGGDTAYMNEVIRQLGNASSLDAALELFNSTVKPDEENEAVADFMELLRKYFG